MALMQHVADGMCAVADGICAVADAHFSHLDAIGGDFSSTPSRIRTGDLLRERQAS
jgi:hypothetical protein